MRLHPLQVVLLVASLAACSEWVDEDTPADVRVITVRGIRHKLVASDEFETPGRFFRDGEDPLFTALELAPNSNEQVNAYNASLAYTEGGHLVLEAKVGDWLAADGTVRHYQTPMLQVCARPADSSHALIWRASPHVSHVRARDPSLLPRRHGISFVSQVASWRSPPSSRAHRTRMAFGPARG